MEEGDCSWVGDVCDDCTRRIVGREGRNVAVEDARAFSTGVVAPTFGEGVRDFDRDRELALRETEREGRSSEARGLDL